MNFFRTFFAKANSEFLYSVTCTVYCTQYTVPHALLDNMFIRYLRGVSCARALRNEIIIEIQFVIHWALKRVEGGCCGLCGS
jgi:hypothetical protein